MDVGKSVGVWLVKDLLDSFPPASFHVVIWIDPPQLEVTKITPFQGSRIKPPCCSVTQMNLAFQKVVDQKQKELNEWDWENLSALKVGGEVRITCFSGPETYLQNTILARWWFQILFIFTPILGKIHILTNIFQRG